jgi:hypothetical protein
MGMLGDDIAGMMLSAVYIAKSTGVTKQELHDAVDTAWASFP